MTSNRFCLRQKNLSNFIVSKKTARIFTSIFTRNGIVFNNTSALLKKHLLISL